MTDGATTSDRSESDTVRRLAVGVLFLSLAAIAVGYAAAFTPNGPPQWSAWVVALCVPIAVVAVMMLGAARGEKGIGRLGIPFILVGVILIVGFVAALALPAAENPNSKLWLGLPLRAAIVIYGIGLLPIVVLPLAYALTFATQTLTADDVERVRALGRAHAERRDELTDSAAANRHSRSKS